MTEANVFKNPEWDPTELLQAMGEAVVAVDRDQRIVLFNRAAEDLFGFPAEAVLGEPLELLLPHEARANHRKFFDGFARSGETRRLMGGRPEIAGRRNDGSLFHAEAALARAGSEGDTIYIAILRDITERLQNRANLNRSNLLLSGISRSLSRVIRGDPIDDVSAEMLAVLMQATDSGFGFLAEIRHGPDGAPALETHAVSDVSRADDLRGCYAESLGAAIRTGEPVIANDAAGEPLESRMWLPVRSGGEVLGIVGIGNRTGGYDETLTGLVEPVLTTYANVIGVYRANAEKAEIEARLAQARRMEAMGQLTGGVAHDFNNLLAIIQGHGEFLAEELGRDHPSLRPILNAARRGAVLTQRLLAFGRRQALRPDAVDPAGLIEGLRDRLASALGDSIRIETDIAPGVAPVAADAGQLENALLNLADNARQAMPDGGTLTVACANVTLDECAVARRLEIQAGEYVRLSVRDTGTGMAEEERKRAFEPFYTTREAGAGSGLGLSMVYGFARQSGGRARISSRPGEGTTVDIYLPRGDRPEDRAGEEDAGAGTPPAPTKATVLVIEDDPDVRTMAMRMLEGLGYAPVAADTVAAARRIVAGGARIDLVLSDVVLPGGISGPDFGKELRRTHPGLRIVYMSGHPTARASAGQEARPVPPLLTKPFTRAELARVVDNAVD